MEAATVALSLLGEEADLIIAASREAEAVAPFAASEMILGVGERWSVKPGGDPEARTPQYYDARPCPRLVWRAARIVEEMLGE